MAQNTSPIFTQTPRIGMGFIDSNAFNNTFTMTTGGSASLFTAGPSGSYVNKIRIKPSGSSAATVLRFFINNGNDTTVSANNTLFAEISLPSITTSATIAQNDFEVPFNIAIPGSYVIYGITATTPLTGFSITTVAGDY
jgi:hypothetical protein